MPQNGGKRKLQAPRIDFTPMVDLGFLLITFFIFTTTMAKPKAMVLNMPSIEPTDSPSKVAEESVITIIPVSGHRTVYFEGMLKDPSQLNVCNNSAVRAVLLAKKTRVANLPASYSRAAHLMYVLIKPNNDCSYADVVQMLDEMNIVDISRYSLGDVAPEEKDMIAKINP